MHGATGANAEPIETLSGEIELELPEFDDPPADPLRLLRHWLEIADRHGVKEARALALATVGEDGRPSSRTVLLRGVDPVPVFTSDRESRKGRQLAVRPWAAGTLYWRETTQQVTLEGPVEAMGEAESDTLFAERTRVAQAATIASGQSEDLGDEEALRARAQELIESGEPLTRPEGWCGYRLVPERIEFWHGSPDRLHRRLLYERAGEGWQHRRLQP
jgi:pyridoxamine 5'-phosphate oxidase